LRQTLLGTLEFFNLIDTRTEVQQLADQITELTLSRESLEKRIANAPTGSAHADNLKLLKKNLVETNVEIEKLNVEMNQLKFTSPLGDIVTDEELDKLGRANDLVGSIRNGGTFGTGQELPENLGGFGDDALLGTGQEISPELGGLDFEAVADPTVENAEKVCAALDKVKECMTEDQIASQALTSNLNTLSDTFGLFADAAGDGVKKHAKAFKAFKTVQIAFATAAAINSALQASTAGGPLGYLKFAVVLAKLMVGVNQIKALSATNASTSNVGTGGISSGIAESNGSQSTNPANEPNREQQQGGNITVQLSGGGILGAELLEELVDQLNSRGLARQLVVGNQ